MRGFVTLAFGLFPLIHEMTTCHPRLSFTFTTTTGSFSAFLGALRHSDEGSERESGLERESALESLGPGRAAS